MWCSMEMGRDERHLQMIHHPSQESSCSSEVQTLEVEVERSRVHQRLSFDEVVRTSGNLYETLRGSDEHLRELHHARNEHLLELRLEKDGLRHEIPERRRVIPERRRKNPESHPRTSFS